MGAMTTRFLSVTSRSVMGVNSSGLVIWRMREPRSGGSGRASNATGVGGCCQVSFAAWRPASELSHVSAVARSISGGVAKPAHERGWSPAWPSPVRHFPLSRPGGCGCGNSSRATLQVLHACFGDKEAMRYWNVPACETHDETERWLAYLAKTSSPYDHLGWAVTEKRGGQCVGMVNYHHREVRHGRLEIGYIVAPSHQGRGLDDGGRRGPRRVLPRELATHRIEALIHPDNIASIRLVERLGFRCEGGPSRPLAQGRGIHERSDVRPDRRAPIAATHEDHAADRLSYRVAMRHLGARSHRSTDVEVPWTQRRELAACA